MEVERAVLVRNANKNLGKNKILKDFNMQINKGTIYGLLGASGCGKTTLVHCIAGRKKLDSGQLSIYSSSLSYMPQEFGLAHEFNSRDVVYYFGRILQLDDSAIKKRYEELRQLLDLPPTNRLIKNCSGGEQRRISFAAALVVIPELLILDEPTTGIGPILREKIWAYLMEITKEHKTTVLLTTHYIQETIRADTVGLMRNGRLLAEKSPQQLLAQYETQHLDDVFLILSQKQEIDSLELPVYFGEIEETNKLSQSKWYHVNKKRLRAFTDKSWKQFYRNFSGSLFAVIFPAIQVFLFLATIGGDPNDLPLAIVNHDSNCSNVQTPAVHLKNNYCHFNDISCEFLKYLNNPMIQKNEYSSLKMGKDSVSTGDSVGVLYFPSDFTKAFEKRSNIYGTHREFDPNGEIKVWMDMANRETGGALKYRILDLFDKFQKQLIKECKFNGRLLDVFRNDTLYGEIDEPARQAIAPGFIMTSMTFFSLTISCHIILQERLEGLWDRSATAGVTTMEIIIGHTSILMGISVLHTIELLLVTFWVFNVKYYGNFWIMTLLVMLQGFLGITLGFAISTTSTNLTMAQGASMFVGILNIFGSGFLWPYEGMPQFLQWISLAFPATLPLQSLRDVMKKDWGFANPEVVYGILVEVIWLIIPLLISILFINSKH